MFGPLGRVMGRVTAYPTNKAAQAAWQALMQYNAKSEMMRMGLRMSICCSHLERKFQWAHKSSSSLSHTSHAAKPVGTRNLQAEQTSAGTQAMQVLMTHILGLDKR